MTAVVSQRLREAIEKHVQISRSEIQAESVQIWSNKIQALVLHPICGSSDLYAWTLAYDSFLGYMKGVLETQDFAKGTLSCF